MLLQSIAIRKQCKTCRSSARAVHCTGIIAGLLLKDRKNAGVRIVRRGRPANFFEPQRFRKDGMARPQGEGMLPHSEPENAASTFLLKRWGVFALVNRG